MRDSFDISEHDWSDVYFDHIDGEGDINLSESFCGDTFYISKHDAIAIAKHFGLTAEDLK